MEVADRTAGLAGFALTGTLTRDIENLLEFAQALESDQTEANVEQFKSQLGLVHETASAAAECGWGLRYAG
jgi:hypothetical protein